MSAANDFLKQLYKLDLFVFPSPIFYKLLDFAQEALARYTEKLKKDEFKFFMALPNEREWEDLPAETLSAWGKIRVEQYAAGEYYQRYMLYGFVTMLYSAFVLYLKNIYECISGKTFRKQKKGSEIGQLKVLLERRGYAVSRCKRWREIDMLRLLRHVIVHSDGYDYKNELRAFSDTVLLFENQLGRQAIVTPEFCRKLVGVAEEFSKSFDELNKGAIDKFVERWWEKEREGTGA